MGNNAPPKPNPDFEDALILDDKSPLFGACPQSIPLFLWDFFQRGTYCGSLCRGRKKIYIFFNPKIPLAEHLSPAFLYHDPHQHIKRMGSYMKDVFPEKIFLFIYSKYHPHSCGGLLDLRILKGNFVG